MTSPTVSRELWQLLHETLDDLCARVELYRAANLPVVRTAAEPPDGTAMWEGSYARVALWPIAGLETDDLRTAATRGQDWLDAVLNDSERTVPSRVIDGYLLLALPKPPTKELEEQIRVIEVSTQVCRKHVVWPQDSQAKL
jgi:hypothetical protein